MNAALQGHAAYKAADPGTTHEAWGAEDHSSLGSFDAEPTMVADRSFEVPQNAGAASHDLLIAPFGGVGTIRHVTNTTGGPANTST
ncbi:hypothetical protein [Sphaerisporangium corydalis]|uniref:Uncharacterized protein n=1 Tax=Sphaerisporangium corydalis TaxID=1441875 RepID=A0ABV9E6Y3_9ACTN|nr:hypothetical protein [Sphaerisporangium corydalis]